jgi:hypothetical protein
MGFFVDATKTSDVFGIQNDCAEGHLPSLFQIQAGDSQETCEYWSQERQQDPAAVPLLCQMLGFGPSVSGGTSAQPGQMKEGLSSCVPSWSLCSNPMDPLEGAVYLGTVGQSLQPHSSLWSKGRLECL